MSGSNPLERARRALDRAVPERADDLEHLSVETREAYVDGTLGEVEREIADAHLSRCPSCVEDVRDLEDVRREPTLVPPAARPGPRTLFGWALRDLAVASGLAASVVLAAWLLGRPPASDQASAPAPAPAPDSVAGGGAAAAVSPQIQAPAPAAAPADTLDAAERAVVDRVLGGGGLAIPDEVRRLTGSTGVLLGSQPPASSFAPAAPRGSALITARPGFLWTARDGATAYSVAVYNDQFNEVMASPRVTGTSWLSPTDLPRGLSYQWQVTAHTASGDVTAPVPPQPEARFRVADSATAADVTRLQQRLKDKPLELGILLAERGFILDALTALDRAAESPATATQATKLRAELAAR